MGGVVGGVGAAAGGLFGMMGGSSASSSQSAAMDAQARLADTQAKIAQEQWDRFLKVFGPLQEYLVKESQTPARENVGFQRMAGGINERYADSAANLRRTMAGRYPSGSPMEGSIQRSLDLSRTKDLTGAEADWNAKRFSDMLNVAQMGQGLPSTAMSGLSSASGTYGNLANMYGNMANAGWGAAGNSLGNLYQMWKMPNSNWGNWSWGSGGSYNPNATGWQPGNMAGGFGFNSWN